MSIFHIFISDFECIRFSFLPLAFNKIGGYQNLERAYATAIPSLVVPNTTCHLPRSDAMHLFRDPVNGDLPWTGMTFGLTILAAWYWCTDQVIMPIRMRWALFPDFFWTPAAMFWLYMPWCFLRWGRDKVMVLCGDAISLFIGAGGGTWHKSR